MTKYNELDRLLKKDGWYVVRQKGSHMIMRHPHKPGPLIVPYHGAKEISNGLLRAILKKAKIRRYDKKS